MQAKGYSQRDVLQAEVQKAYAEGIGPAPVGADAHIGPALGEGMRDGPGAEASVPTWDCPACGSKNIKSRFCPECGAKRPEAPKGWICPACGTKEILSKFCPNCGAKKPAETWTCPECGATDIKTKFCPECGRKRGE